MPDKTPAEKLRLKPGMIAALLHVPAEVDLGIPEEVTLRPSADWADFIREFVTTQSEAEERVAALASFVGDNTTAWIGYPKGSNAKGYDVNRDTTGACVRDVGLILNANFSIDEKWSAVRVRPIRAGE